MYHKMTNKYFIIPTERKYGGNNNAGQDKHECNFTKQFFFLRNPQLEKNES